MAGRILVIRGGAIGDFVLTLPVFSALRAQFPKAHLEVLGYPHIARLAEVGGLVDLVAPIEARALAGFFARGGSLDPEMASHFSRFDLIISFLFDPDQIFRTNVGLCAKAQFIQGPHRPPADATIHATEVFLKPLEQLAIFGADPTPRLRIEERAVPRSLAEDLGAGSWIAGHPGSGSEAKNWPEANWEGLFHSIIGQTNHNILLIGGEAEGDRLKRLAKALPAERIRVAQSRPLAELAKLILQCEHFVGHDSGISHLASALGLKGIILWGETSSTIWRPRSDAIKTLHSPDGLKSLSPDTVSTAILESLVPKPR